jgi:hypothetical protein
MFPNPSSVALSLAASISLCAMVGCGGNGPTDEAPNPADRERSLLVDDAEGDAFVREAEKQQWPTHAEAEKHFSAAGEVYDVMLADIGPSTVHTWAVQLLPNATAEEQQEYADKLSRILRSDDFRRDYSKILMETLSEEECDRLAEILADAVVKKFQQRKVEYLIRLATLLENYQDKVVPEEENAK